MAGRRVSGRGSTSEPPRSLIELKLAPPGGLTVDGWVPSARFEKLRQAYGRVAVFVDSMTVSKASLGSRFTGDPTPAQRRQHETAHFVLRRAVERNPSP